MPKKSKAKSKTTKTAKLAGTAASFMPGGRVTGAITEKAVAAMQARMPGRTSKAQARAALMKGRKGKSAKSRLKRAYERRAMRQIAMGQLGAARKTLARKRSVV